MIKRFTITISQVGTGEVSQATQDLDYGSSLTVHATPDASTNFTG